MPSFFDHPSAGPPRMTAEGWLDAVKRDERRGELLDAFDLAERGLSEYPDDLALKHRAVLALARAGATQEAARRYSQYSLEAVGDEDISALRARIAKDLAMAAQDHERSRQAAAAAELYGGVFDRTGGYYPAINAATMWLLAGDQARARSLAGVVLELLAASGDPSYYAAATEAEAHLLRGEEADARLALERAAARHHGDYGAVATTRRQLRMICGQLGIDSTLLEVLAGPKVVHFCGHRIASADEPGRFPAEVEWAVAARIAEVVGQHRAGFAYGSLAGGADILWAQALLSAGSELHVVLPFALEEFIERSVAPSGDAWVGRFYGCMDAATTVRYATEEAFLGDDVLFRYCSELAMGLALLRAQYLDAEVRQLAVWDGGPAYGAAGTTIDIATWRRSGRSATFVYPDADASITDADAALASAEDEALSSQTEGDGEIAGRIAHDGPGGRIVRALLFGDVQGFSKLTDQQLPIFAARVLGAFAAVLDRHDGEVWHQNSWGDAIYIVLSDPVAAAQCALELQYEMAALDLTAEGLPPELALRIGGHVGPVFPIHDPVIEKLAFMGSHVSRTARIEPVAPPGAVYVTEQFAAALVLNARGEFACDYVGHMAAAKDYGRLRMYRLRRNARAALASLHQPPTR